MLPAAVFAVELRDVDSDFRLVPACPFVPGLTVRIVFVSGWDDHCSKSCQQVLNGSVLVQGLPVCEGAGELVLGQLDWLKILRVVGVDGHGAS